MTWLVIEPQFDGHHFAYLERIVEGAIDRGIPLVVGVADDQQGERTMTGLRRRLGQRAPEFVVAPAPKPCRVFKGPLRLACNEIRRRRFFKEVYARALERRPISFVFLPYVDWALFAITVLGSPFERTFFSGITMRQRFHFHELGIRAAHDKLNPAKGKLFRRFLRIPTLKTVFTLDETLPEYLYRTGAKGAEKVVHIPDPSDVKLDISRQEARSTLGLPDDACVVLVYGHLNLRKGIPRLVEWVSGHAVPQSVHLVAVGTQSTDVEALLASGAAGRMEKEGRIHAVNRFVSDEDGEIFFRAADLVWLAYDNFDLMSGILVRAAQHGLAVVFHDRGLISRYAKTYGRAVRRDEECSALLLAVPSELTIRKFDPKERGRPLPDHSWANALQLIYG